MLAARELMFAIDLALEFGLTSDGPTVIYSAILSPLSRWLTYNPVSFKKTKHIIGAQLNIFVISWPVTQSSSSICPDRV